MSHEPSTRPRLNRARVQPRSFKQTAPNTLARDYTAPAYQPRERYTRQPLDTFLPGPRSPVPRSPGRTYGGRSPASSPRHRRVMQQTSMRGSPGNATTTTPPYALRTQSVDEMMGRGGKTVNGRVQTMPQYDALSDPALGKFWAKKFGWTIAAPAAGGYPGPSHSHSHSHGGGYGSGGGSGPMDYAVTLFTAENQPGTGSAAQKYITLKGKLGTSHELPLEGPPHGTSSGATHTYYVSTHKIGVLRQIVLRSDARGDGDDWLCEAVVVKPVHKNKEYTFACGRWLRQDRGGGEASCTLSLVGEDGGAQGPGRILEYQLTVATGNCRNAGTKDEVYAKLFGTKGESALVRLQGSHYAPFEKGRTYTFVINIKDVGKLQKLRLERAGRDASGWFVEAVTALEIRADVKTTFRCNDWLSLTEGKSPSMWKELVSDAGVGGAESGETEFEIMVHTADKRYAGTAARVAVTLYGTAGEFGPFELREGTAGKLTWPSFTRGSQKLFKQACPNVGALQRIRIGHDNTTSGASWLLGSVVIKDNGSGLTYRFACDRWMAKDRDDGHTYRELVAGDAANLGSWTGKVFHVTIVTADTSAASTNAQVHCTLQGSLGNSGKIQLENNSKNFSRNRTDKFKIDCADIGDLQSVVLGHDNSGNSPNWCITKMWVEYPALGKTYHMDIAEQAMLWLATDRGDGQIERTLPIDDARTTVFSPRGVWRCTVHTSDVQYSGTDAAVYLTVYGEGGKKSDEVRLTNKNDNFERGQADEFKIELESLGCLHKARIHHDNGGLMPGWKLDKLVLTHVESEIEYSFAACAPSGTESSGTGRWLSRSAEDGEIVRELPAAGKMLKEVAPLLLYEVTCLTGNTAGADTSGEVFIDIYGSKGSTGERWLRKSTTPRQSKFSKGKTDTFAIEAVDLGDLTHVRIFVKKKGTTWQCETIKVAKRGVPASEVEFPCHKWLASNKDDGLMDRVLMAAGAAGVQADTTEYLVSVTTSDIKYAGTDANVFVQMFGSLYDTGKILLKESETFKDKFERDHTDRFTVESVDIGPIRKIVVGHDGKGIGSGWHLATIDITVPAQSKKYQFACNRWLSSSEDDGEIVRELMLDTAAGVDKIEKSDSYELKVYTSEVAHAGTNANVYAVFYGEDGKKTDELHLRHKGNNFGQGQMDRFRFNFPQIGALSKVRVWHDNKGLGGDWHLNYIEMRHLKTNRIYTFVGEQWLSKSKGLVAELPVSKTEDISAEGKRELVAMETPIALPTEYTVTVVTADEAYSGTDANVFINIWGENGDLGERALKKSLNHRDKFERGHSDVFTLTGLNLGKLWKVTVHHDNHRGIKQLKNPSWKLDRIVVLDGTTDAQYDFPCGKWLSKEKGDQQISRELAVKDAAADGAGDEDEPLNIAEVATKYHISVHTSDIQYAGTDATVFIQLYGDKTTDEITLAKSETHKDKFERGHIDKFVVEALGVNDLQKIKIGHNNKGLAGMSDNWHLDKVEIDAPSLGKSWTFPCGKWFAKGKEDNQIERFLAPGAADGADNADGEDAGVTVYKPKMSYEILVYTSDVSGAGTDNDVTMTIFGCDVLGKEASTEVKITHDFKRGTGTAKTKSGDLSLPDKFLFDIDDVGIPYKLLVNCQPSGRFSNTCSWHVEKIVLVKREKDHDNDERYEFPCGKWFATDKSKDGGVYTRELVLQKRVGFTSEGRVKEKHKSLAEDLTMKTYKITVVTGDVSKAGTDANMFIEIKGRTDRSSGERPLKKSLTHRDKFERGKTDIFLVEAIDIGDLASINIRHDNHSNIHHGASWFCDKVIIEIEEDHKRWEFPCQQWLSSDKKYGTGDCKISRTIPVLLDAAQVTAAAQKAKAKAEKAEKELTRLSADVPKQRREELEKRLTLLQTAAQDAEDVLSVTRDGAKRRGEEIEYEITVATGDKANSGTTADVHVEIMGRKFGPIDKNAPSPSKPAKEGATAKYTVSVTTHADGPSTAGSARLFLTGSEMTTEVDLVNDGQSCFQKGATDSFSLDLPLLGDITAAKLQLQKRDGDLGQDAAHWRPTNIEIVDIRSKRTYQFSCVGTLEADSSPMQLNFLGDGQINLTSTGKMLLSDSRRLDKGTRVTYIKSGPDVGELVSVKVTLADEHTKDDWYLDNITVLVRSRSKNYAFPCGDWFGAKQGDKKSERILKVDHAAASFKAEDTLSVRSSQSPSRSPSIKSTKSSKSSKSGRSSASSADQDTGDFEYKIITYTADEKNAGTDARVYISIVGACGDVTDRKLKKSTAHNDPFEKGHRDVFHIKSEYLGELSRIRIRHDNHKGIAKRFSGGGASWLLDKVEVQEVQTANSYTFQCGKWLSSSHDDKLTERELVCSSSDVRSRTHQYTMAFKTAGSGPGTLHGIALHFQDKDKTYKPEVIKLANSGNFSAGATAQFAEVHLMHAITGTETVAVKIDVAAGDAASSGWGLQELTITQVSNGNVWVLRGEGEVAPDGLFHPLLHDKAVLGQVDADKGKAMVEYHITTKTSDIYKSGTDAGVTVVIHGKSSNTGPRKLLRSSTHDDKFERNHEDAFIVESIDLGPLDKLELSTDGAGGVKRLIKSADWHCEWVKVEKKLDDKVIEVVVFPCNNWLRKKETLERVLFPAPDLA